MSMSSEILYQLENGNYLFIQTLSDDPEYYYGYDYFDKDKKIIDGGVFNTDSPNIGINSEAIETALSWCDLPTDMKHTVLEENPDLEELGFTGF